MRRWLDAWCFENLVHDLRLLARLDAGRDGQPSGAIFDARVVPSTPESAARAARFLPLLAGEAIASFT